MLHPLFLRIVRTSLWMMLRMKRRFRVILRMPGFSLLDRWRIYYVAGIKWRYYVRSCVILFPIEECSNILLSHSFNSTMIIASFLPIVMFFIYNYIHILLDLLLTLSISLHNRSIFSFNSFFLLFLAFFYLLLILFLLDLREYNWGLWFTQEFPVGPELCILNDWQVIIVSLFNHIRR
jgi:hypothetical protein